MNMQNLMRQAQQMQKDIQKIQKELETTEYVGVSSLVEVTINGKKEAIKVVINNKNDLEKDDLDILDDMIVVAINDAVKKADNDKEKKLAKYQGLAGML